jgi:hypothetical protein
VQLSDDPTTDGLDHLGNVGIDGRLDFDKPRLEPLAWVIHLDAIEREEVMRTLRGDEHDLWALGCYVASGPFASGSMNRNEEGRVRYGNR